jgi:hypothetical protein
MRRLKNRYKYGQQEFALRSLPVVLLPRFAHALRQNERSFLRVENENDERAGEDWQGLAQSLLQGVFGLTRLSLVERASRRHADTQTRIAPAAFAKREERERGEEREEERTKKAERRQRRPPYSHTVIQSCLKAEIALDRPCPLPSALCSSLYVVRRTLQVYQSISLSVYRAWMPQV